VGFAEAAWGKAFVTAHRRQLLPQTLVPSMMPVTQEEHVVKTCSSCGKKVPLATKVGHTCIHCGGKFRWETTRRERRWL
jgi:predicted RNA-binding Zn-ribbon protein involved in translation (DUF1610 family)